MLRSKSRNYNILICLAFTVFMSLKFPATFKTLFSIGPIVFSELDDSASCFGQSSMKQTIE